MALLSLRLLLESPNPKDPQDAEVAKMMMDDPAYFNVVAHDWAVKYAGAPRTMPPPGQYQKKVVEKQPDDPSRYIQNKFVSYPRSLVSLGC
jgi:ubiquitin-conjugating enzyme (huntingtin interacting protein 2)